MKNRETARPYQTAAIRMRTVNTARVSAAQTRPAGSRGDNRSSFNTDRCSADCLMQMTRSLDARGYWRTKKGSGLPEPLLRWRDRLLQRTVDRRELAVQVAAQAVHDGDDGERDAGGDEAVFDRGRTGFVLQETRNEVLHN